MPYQYILVDDPRPRVRRITLNRPEKRNALNNRLRAEVFEVEEISRGAPTCRPCERRDPYRVIYR